MENTKGGGGIHMHLRICKIPKIIKILLRVDKK
jgi:hypothetical protein